MLEYRIFGDRGHIVFDVNEGTAVIYGPSGEIHRLPGLPAEERYPDWAPADNLVDVVLGRGANGSPASLGVLHRGIRRRDVPGRAGRPDRADRAAGGACDERGNDRPGRGVPASLCGAEQQRQDPPHHARPPRDGERRRRLGRGDHRQRGRLPRHEGDRRSGLRAAAHRPRPARRRGDLVRIPRDHLLDRAMAASSPLRSAPSTWRSGISPGVSPALPLHRLLGGKRRDRVRAASSIIFDTGQPRRHRPAVRRSSRPRLSGAEGRLGPRPVDRLRPRRQARPRHRQDGPRGRRRRRRDHRRRRRRLRLDGEPRHHHGPRLRALPAVLARGRARRGRSSTAGSGCAPRPRRRSAPARRAGPSRISAA